MRYTFVFFICFIYSMPAVIAQDTLACQGICDEFTQFARAYIDKMTAGASREMNKYASMADFQVGSEQFGINGNASLGQLTIPQYNCMSGQNGKVGTGDFGLKPSYLIAASIFGQKVAILDVRLSGKQRGYGSDSESDRNLNLSVKLLGIDILNKKNRGPQSLMTAGSGSGTQAGPEAPKKSKEGTGGKLLDISRSISQSMGGQMPRIDIFPPVLYVGVDAGFTLQAKLMFTYGVDSPFFNFRSTTNIVAANPLNDGASFCEAPVGGVNNECKLTGVTTTERGSEFYDAFKAGVNTVKNGANAVKLKVILAREKIRALKEKEFYKDALAINKKASITTNTGEMCGALSSVLRPISDYQSKIQGKIDSVKDSTVQQFVDGLGTLYRKSEQAANLVGGILSGSVSQVPEMTADVAVRLNGRASVWASAVLTLDAGIAQGYAGIEGKVLLVDASMGVAAKLSTKSKYLDLTAEFIMVRLQAELNAIYGLIIGRAGVEVEFKGTKNLLSFQGYSTSKDSLIARLDFRPSSGEDPFIWCGGIFGGTPSDPLRCDDTPGGFSEIAMGLALHDKIKTEYLGEPTYDLAAECVVKTIDGQVVATMDQSACDLNRLPVNQKIIDGFRTKPETFISYLRNSQNKITLGLKSENLVTGADSYTLATKEESPQMSLVGDRFIPFSIRPHDASSDNLKDLVFTLTSLGVKYVDRANVMNTSGDDVERQADPEDAQFQFKVGGDRSLGVTAEIGDKSIFAGDLISLSNEVLYDMALNYRLGACTIQEEDRSGITKRFLKIRNTSYPKVPSDKLSTEDIKTLAAGELSEIIGIDGVGCNDIFLSSGLSRADVNQVKAFAACHLRKALSEEICFPPDKVKELVYMGNLTDEEIWNLFKAKKISGVLSPKLEAWSVTQTNSNLPFGASGCPVEALTPIERGTPYFSQTPSYIPVVPVSLTDRKYVWDTYWNSTHYDNGVQHNLCHQNKQILYEADFNFRFLTKPTNTSTSEFPTAGPGFHEQVGRPIFSNNGLYFGTSIPQAEDLYNDSQELTVLVRSIKDCIIGNESESCHLQLEGQDLAASESQTLGQGLCQVKHGTLNQGPEITSSSVQECLVSKGLNDINLYCNKNSDSIFTSSQDTTISVVFKKMASNMSSRLGGQEINSDQQVLEVGVCKRRLSFSGGGVVIVGQPTAGAQQSSASSVGTPASSMTIGAFSNSGVSPVPFMSSLSDPGVVDNCQLAIGATESDKKVFTTAFAQVPTPYTLGLPTCRTDARGTICPDQNTVWRHAASKNNEKVKFYSSCFGRALNQDGATEQAKLNNFCNSLPVNFLKQILPLGTQAGTQTLYLEIGLIPGQLPTESDLQFYSDGSMLPTGASVPGYKKTCQLSATKVSDYVAASCGFTMTQGSSSLKVKVPLVRSNNVQQPCKESIDRTLFNVRYPQVVEADLAAQVTGSAPYWAAWRRHQCTGIRERPEMVLFNPLQTVSIRYEGTAYNPPDSYDCAPLMSSPYVAPLGDQCKLLSWVIDPSLNGGHRFFGVTLPGNSNSSCASNITAAMSDPIKKSLICEKNKSNYVTSNSNSTISRATAQRHNWSLLPYLSAGRFTTNIAFQYLSTGEQLDSGNQDECQFLLIPTKADDYSSWKNGGSIADWGSEAHPVRMVTGEEFRTYDQQFGSEIAVLDDVQCILQAKTLRPSFLPSYNANFLPTEKGCLTLERNQRIVFAGAGAKAVLKLPVTGTVTCEQLFAAVDGGINRVTADRNGVVKAWYRQTDANSVLVGSPPREVETPDLTCIAPNFRVGLFKNGSLLSGFEDYLSQEMQMLAQRPINYQSALGLMSNFLNPTSPSTSPLCLKIASDPRLPSGSIDVRLGKGGPIAENDYFPQAKIITCDVPVKSCKMALVNDFIPGRPLANGVLPAELEGVISATSIDTCMQLSTASETARFNANQLSLCSTSLSQTNVSRIDRTRPYSLVASYGGSFREIRKCPLSPSITEVPFVENGVLKLKHNVTAADKDTNPLTAFVFLERSTDSTCQSYVPLYSSDTAQGTEGGFLVRTTDPISVRNPATGQTVIYPALPGQSYCLKATAARASTNLKVDAARLTYNNSPFTIKVMVVPGRCEIEADIGLGLPKLYVGSGSRASKGPFAGNYAGLEGADNYYVSSNSCLEKINSLTSGDVCDSLINGSGDLPTNRNSLLTRFKFGSTFVNLPVSMSKFCEKAPAPVIPTWGASDANRCFFSNTMTLSSQESAVDLGQLISSDTWPKQTVRQVTFGSQSANGTVTATYDTVSRSLPLIDTSDECRRQVNRYKGRSCTFDFVGDPSFVGEGSTAGHFLDDSWPLDACSYPAITAMNLAGINQWVDTSFNSKMFKDINCTQKADVGGPVMCLSDRLNGDRYKAASLALAPSYGRYSDDNVRVTKNHLLFDPTKSQYLSGPRPAQNIGSVFIVFRNSGAKSFSTPLNSDPYVASGPRLNSLGKVNGAAGMFHGDNQNGPEELLKAYFRDNGFDYLQKWVFPRPKLYRIFNWNLVQNLSVPSVVTYLGSDRGISGRSIGGGFAELLIFNRDLSQAEIQRTEGYLACKWGLQKDLYPGHPYRLSLCSNNFDDEVPEKPVDKLSSLETSKQESRVEGTVKISQSKEFCGAMIDLTNAKTKTLTIGFCAEDSCEAGKERFVRDYEYQDLIRWSSAEFAKSGDRNLILERLGQKKDFISVILYLDGKKEPAQLPLLSLDETLSKRCLN